MLTPRGWWMLLITLTVGVMGGVLALRGYVTLLIVCLAIFTWFTIEWVVFFQQARIAIRHLHLTRTVADNRGPVRSTWAGQSYTVRAQLRLDRGQLRYIVANDRPPTGASIVDGQTEFRGEVNTATDIQWSYRIHCDRIGVIRFEGVRLRLADYQGFFYFETFLRAAMELPALPRLASGLAARRGDKRLNMLPPPGVHRFRRPGTGSELLELRDYRPGDPPKRIAWKVSARRDELITREFESEVPLRCTLIIDASSATRLGQIGETPLARLCVIAAAVAQSAIGSRDLVGLAICRDDGCDYLSPARTSAHLIQILGKLAQTAALQPTVATHDIRNLVRLAHALATDVYPDMMSPGINRFPTWMPWVFPQTRPDTNVGQRLWQRVANINSPGVRRRYAWRKRLAALVTAKYQLPPGALALCLDDDLSCAEQLQRLLTEHRLSFDVPRDHPQLSDPKTLHQQARALTRAVTRGRDNELFVLMGDYVRRSGQLTELLRAVRTARGRHHQLLAVQPDRPPESPQAANAVGAQELVKLADHHAAWRRWNLTRRAFARLGVTLTAADSGDPVGLILHRLEQMRMIQGAGRR